MDKERRREVKNKNAKEMVGQERKKGKERDDEEK